MTEPTAYTLRIDEPQRAALLELVSALPRPLPDDHPLVYWREMLVELPAHEREQPGCLHGFCL